MPVSPNNDDNNTDNQSLPRSSSGDPSSRESHLKKASKKKIPTAKEEEKHHPLGEVTGEPCGSTTKSSKSKSKVRSHQEIETLTPLDQDVPSNGPTTPEGVISSSSTAQSAIRRTRSLGREESRRSKTEEDKRPSRSGSKKCGSGGQISKILLCASGGDRSSSSLGSTTGDSKRKEVDENNPTSLNPADASSVLTHRGRKASRKGSKKKSKETIPLNTLEDREQQHTTNSLDNNADNDNAKDGKTSQNSNKSCCFCWCCCCSCSW